MSSTWIIKYNNQIVKVVNTWFNGEFLYVNGKLQDQQFNIASANLTGLINDSEGNERSIKVNLGGFFQVNCMAFIGNEKIETIKV